MNKFFNSSVNFGRKNRAAADVVQKFTENFRQFLFTVMVRSDIEDNGVVHLIIQQTFVTFISFKNKISAAAGTVISCINLAFKPL